jgi:hypothetical protein
VAVCLLGGACTGDGDSADDTTTTAAASPPLALAAAVPAPESVTYVSESTIDATGYWTGYVIDGELDLAAYGERLEILGWTAGEVDEGSLSATMDGAWLDVAVADDGSVGVCVFNTAPDAETCATFPSTLSDSTTTTTSA